MVPIKFRCYRCNKLLGVSPSKIGVVVSCPKCSAELVVPDPDESDLQMLPDASTIIESPFPAPGPRSEPLPAGLPLDALNLRPEDIRVEPGVRETRPTIPSPEFMQATAVLAEEPVRVPPPTAPRPQAQAPEPSVPTPSPTVVQVAVGPKELPIRVEPPAATPSRTGPVVVRARDLVIPRSVVASWSLFVLLALMFAFFAGLLAGHYIWRVHSPRATLGLERTRDLD